MNYTPGVDYSGSLDLPLPPRIYPPPLYCDYVKCLRLPESTPPSQNIPSLFNKFTSATLPGSTSPSQNIPPALQTVEQHWVNVSYLPGNCAKHSCRRRHVVENFAHVKWNEWCFRPPSRQIDNEFCTSLARPSSSHNDLTTLLGLAKHGD